MGLPENAGRPWSSEEETSLLRSFEAGANINQLARQFGRTPQAIQGRLYRLGKVPQWRLGASQDGQQLNLDGLNAAARGLLNADFSADELPLILRAEIASLQRACGKEVVFCNGRGGVWFAWKSPKFGNSVSVRKPNQVRFLSGKIDGVWIVVNLHKAGVYRHENARVAAALRALAEAIERTETPLADHDMQLAVDE